MRDTKQIGKNYNNLTLLQFNQAMYPPFEVYVISSDFPNFRTTSIVGESWSKIRTLIQKKTLKVERYLLNENRWNYNAMEMNSNEYKHHEWKYHRNTEIDATIISQGMTWNLTKLIKEKILTSLSLWGQNCWIICARSETLIILKCASEKGCLDTWGRYDGYIDIGYNASSAQQ